MPSPIATNIGKSAIRSWKCRWAAGISHSPREISRRKATVMIRHGVREVSMKQTQERDTATVQTTTLRIAGMSCGACVRHVTRAVDGMTGVVHVEVDLQTGQAVVEHLPESVDETALIAAVTDAGYSVSAIDRDVYTDRDDAGRCCCG